MILDTQSTLKAVFSISASRTPILAVLKNGLHTFSRRLFRHRPMRSLYRLELCLFCSHRRSTTNIWFCHRHHFDMQVQLHGLPQKGQACSAVFFACSRYPRHVVRQRRLEITPLLTPFTWLPFPRLQLNYRHKDLLIRSTAFRGL